MIGLVALGLLGPEPARARISGDVGYTYDQAWQATIRLIRVDLGCNITERDADTGFVLFEYANQGRSYPGSVELVRTADGAGNERVRVTVQVSAMPSYVERMVLDRLTRKLREDFGDARSRQRPPARPAPTPPSDDDGDPDAPGTPPEGGQASDPPDSAPRST